MDVVFADEMSGLREFDDFARMGGIRVDRVTIAGQQMTVRCEGQRYGTTQVRVSKDACSRCLTMDRRWRHAESVNRIVGFRGDVENIRSPVIEETGRTQYKRGRVCPVLVSRSDLSGGGDVTVSLSGSDTSIRITVPFSTFEMKTLAWSKSSLIAKPQGPSRLLAKVYIKVPCWSINRSGPAATVSDVPSVVVTLPTMTNPRWSTPSARVKPSGGGVVPGRKQTRSRPPPRRWRREVDDCRPGPLEIIAVIEFETRTSPDFNSPLPEILAAQRRRHRD